MAKRKPKDPKELLEYGHWNTSICGDFDPNDYVAFVYAVHLKDGHKYIGAKKFWARINRPPSSFKRGPKKPLSEHKWRSYNTSSSILKEASEDSIEDRYILGYYDKWGTALMAEFIWQFELNVCRSEMFLNYQMGGNFTKNTYPDNEIYNNIERYKQEFVQNCGLL